MKISLSLLRRMSVGRQLALAFAVVLCLTGAPVSYTHLPQIWSSLLLHGLPLFSIFV